MVNIIKDLNLHKAHEKAMQQAEEKAQVPKNPAVYKDMQNIVDTMKYKHRRELKLKYY